MALEQEKAINRWYSARIIADTDYADVIVLLKYALAQAESQLHSLERTAGDIGLHVNADPIYPTPPLGQDMTQGQFFKRSLADLNSEFSFS